MMLELTSGDYGQTPRSAETDAGCVSTTKSWREKGAQKAWSYFRSNVRSHLAVVSERVDLTKAIVAATAMNLWVARTHGVSIKLDLLDLVTTQGDPRLLSRSIAALLACVVEASDPTTCVNCCLTPSNARFATILIEVAPAPAFGARLLENPMQIEDGGASIVSGAERGTLSAWLARLVIEEHGGLVETIVATGRPSGLAITLPAKFI